MTRLFDTHVAVDWSARSAPSPAKPSKDAIWFAVVRDGAAETPEYHRTRADAIKALKALLLRERAAGRRVLVGFDFPFGYPSGVAERICGTPSGLALIRWFAEAVEDGADNSSNRYEVASRINALYDGVGPCWGRSSEWDFPQIPVTAKARHGTDHPPERRIADSQAKGAKTVWQLAYAGSVGSQVILGLPALHALRNDPALAGDLAIWPFDTGLARGDAPVVLAEIYPSLLQRQAQAAQAEDEVLDSAQVRVSAAAFAALDAAGSLAPLFAGSPELGPEEQDRVAREEAWILGLGHEAALLAAVPLPMKAPKPRTKTTAPMRPYLKDPAAIYAQSFATVRREARLDRFPEGLDRLAERVIHACGMIEVADRLAFTPSAYTAGRAALAAGAPVICDCEMVGAGIIRRFLPGNDVLVTLNDPRTPDFADRLGTTRSAAAVELWRDRLEGAVVAIGNAPTALFHLLEALDGGAAKPALILGFPVGFVGAAESKAELAANSRGCDFVTLRGRRGGSAMASAAVNALASGLTDG
ncbi:hypothetical protein PSAL_022740 [Pseudooceanicola algae]|uniref:Cobalamin biosynthesis precorrin-8X methylmutase CobH/CbiC domain-containing protein n=2 Tax=Pseudooceanicola algae TaxID=1537215 RepID=A0A418SKM0_9RHOB|nr:hypothetical protein PSAL_022740 [Pseudooceanicola algae]